MVYKRGGRTDITRLGDEERVTEIAKMLSGSEITDAAVAQAQMCIRDRGGLGFNVRKFFIDFRISGYPRSRVWHDFTSEGIARRVKVPHDIVYGGSLGFFF